MSQNERVNRVDERREAPVVGPICSALPIDPSTNYDHPG